jgi:hypothetical protein
VRKRRGPERRRKCRGLTAARAERADDQIPLFEFFHALANFDNLAEHLVAHGIVECIVETAVRVQVGA